MPDDQPSTTVGEVLRRELGRAQTLINELEERQSSVDWAPTYRRPGVSHWKSGWLKNAIIF
jgi:hypothetical protein